MAELIEAACDICGAKYNWSDERLGQQAVCRECGVKFEVAEYVPPSEDRESENSPWMWFRGAGVAVLVITMVGLLASLPFVRPEQRQPNQVAANQRVSSTPYSPTTSGSFTQPGPVAGNFQSQNNLSDRLKEQQERLRKQSEAHRKQMEEAQKWADEIHRRGPIDPGFRRGPFGSPPGFNGPPVNPPASPPANPPSANPSEGQAGGEDPNSSSQQEASAGPTEPAEPGPTITEWRFRRRQGARYLRLTGTGFDGTKKVERWNGQNLLAVPFEAVSDTRIDLPGLDSVEPKTVMFVVTTPAGVAVAFSESIPTIEGEHDAAPDEGMIFWVKKKGRLKSTQSIVVLVEKGGRAHVEGTTALAFMKEGSRLETVLVRSLVAEAGAKLTTDADLPPMGEPPEILRFCPLSELPGGE